MRQPESQEEDGPSVHDRLHSAPKGLLRYYILHKIAQKPIHGYEIIQDIDSKTEGAWRPGAGSLYPILKKLVSEGLIKADPEPSNEATRRVYQITPKGVESLAHAKEMFANFQQRFGSLRRLFIELIDPENLATFFVDGSNRQFQMAQEMLETKQDLTSRPRLHLERVHAEPRETDELGQQNAEPFKVKSGPNSASQGSQSSMIDD